MKSRRTGFTVLEMLLAMFVVAAVLTGVTAMYLTGLKDLNTSQATSTNSSSGQDIVLSLDRDIMQSVTILSTYTVTGLPSANGAYTTGGDTVILQTPVWDAINLKTISGVYDTIIYQYVTASGTHKVYNLRRISVPGAGSSKALEDRYLLPYSSTRDATDATLYQSNPYLSYLTPNTSLFTYWVQDTVTPGQVKQRTTETFDNVCVIETAFTLNRQDGSGWVTNSEDLQSRLRNWKPPGT